MELQNKDNKFVSYIFILLSLILVVFFARDEYAQLQSNSDLKKTKIEEEKTLTSENAKLKDIQVKLS
jgi:hypothetical protein